jgi:hypothetical protein
MQIYLFLYGKYELPCLAFMKLREAHQHYVQISYTEFHPNRTVSAEGNK